MTGDCIKGFWNYIYIYIFFVGNCMGAGGGLIVLSACVWDPDAVGRCFLYSFLVASGISFSLDSRLILNPTSPSPPSPASSRPKLCCDPSENCCEDQEEGAGRQEDAPLREPEEVSSLYRRVWSRIFGWIHISYTKNKKFCSLFFPVTLLLPPRILTGDFWFNCGFLILQK